MCVSDFGTFWLELNRVCLASRPSHFTICLGNCKGMNFCGGMMHRDITYEKNNCNMTFFSCILMIYISLQISFNFTCSPMIQV